MKTWHTQAEMPPTGMIVCQIPDEYVECLVEVVDGRFALFSEERVEWSEVIRWTPVIPDAYKIEDGQVVHSRN